MTRLVLAALLACSAWTAQAEAAAFLPHLSYMTYVGPDAREGDTPLLAKYTRELSDAGVKTFVFVSDLGNVYGYSPTVWPEPGRFDFRYLDRHVQTILNAAAPDAKIILQLYVDAPLWWCQQNPAEMMVLDNGKTEFPEKYFALPRTGPFPSIASGKWRADMDAVLKALVEHVQQSPYAARVGGYQATGLKTQEWYHWSMNTPELGDYSAPMVASWQSWLRQRYGGEVSRLRAAWNSPEANFDAPIPSREARYGGTATFRDPSREQAVIDFHRFWSWIMADTIGHFCDTLRGLGAPSVGAFYGYSAEFADLAEDAGHLGLPRPGQSAPDYMMAPTSYYRRGLVDGQALLRSPRAGDGRAGLVPWCDFDAASYLIKNKDQAALAPWIASMGVTDTAEQFGWMMRRQWAACRASGGHMALFDLHGGYYDDPEILASVRAIETLSEKAGPAPAGGGPAEISVVLDEDSCHFLRFRDTILQRLLIQQLAEMPFVAPFAFHVGPIERLAPETKLVIFLNQLKLSAAERDRLHALLRERHATAVFLYAPGYFADDGAVPSQENIARTIGMRVAAAARPPTGLKFNVDGNDIYWPNADPFVVTDPNAETLAASGLPEGGAAVAKIDNDGVPTIFAASAPLPRGFLRKIAAAAGVHLYHERAEDSIYSDGRYLALAAGNSAGERTLTFPRKVILKDALTGAPCGDAGNAFDVPFRPLEVRIFEFEPTQ